jgi:hypothetical protein
LYSQISLTITQIRTGERGIADILQGQQRRKILRGMSVTNMKPHQTTWYNTPKDSTYLSGISVRINSSGEESYCF